MRRNDKTFLFLLLFFAFLHSAYSQPIKVNTSLCMMCACQSEVEKEEKEDEDERKCVKKEEC